MATSTLPASTGRIVGSSDLTFSFLRRRGAGEAIKDRAAEAVLWDRHHGNARETRGSIANGLAVAFAISSKRLSHWTA